MTIPSGKQKSSPASCFSAQHGLSVPASALKALQKRGIYFTPGISVEHQHLAKRYVLRGVESGGGVVDMGRACAYLSQDGSPLRWLQSIDSIAVNGRHAIFLAESLVRIEMLGVVRTYQIGDLGPCLVASIGTYTPGDLFESALLRTRRRSTGRFMEGRPPGNARRIGSYLLQSRWRGDGLAAALRRSDQENNIRRLLHRLQAHARRGAANCRGSCGTTPKNKMTITAGAPNWAPLERVLSNEECADFLYMGRAGEIELYKHRLTRHYLNISLDGHSFYRYFEGAMLRSRDPLRSAI
jgi:hypothetical protein